MVEFAGQKVNAKAGTDGKWMLKLKSTQRQRRTCGDGDSEVRGGESGVGKERGPQEMTKSKDEVPIRELRTDIIPLAAPFAQAIIPHHKNHDIP